VWKCVDDDQLLDTAREMAKRAASAPRELVIKTKESIRDMAGNADLRLQLDERLQAALKMRLARYGLAVVQVTVVSVGLIGERGSLPAASHTRTCTGSRSSWPGSNGWPPRSPRSTPYSRPVAPSSTTRSTSPTATPSLT